MIAAGIGLDAIEDAVLLGRFLTDAGVITEWMTGRMAREIADASGDRRKAPLRANASARLRKPGSDAGQITLRGRRKDK